MERNELQAALFDAVSGELGDIYGDWETFEDMLDRGPAAVARWFRRNDSMLSAECVALHALWVAAWAER